ncbi:hypothetical protein [Kitasatospora sp. NRRL B-11411]|uniref:hypothetical protein n=1 Tax=Kitasatospora sp. NRRL B-11411 TaxID=1463822 RepID=UPI0004C3A3CF|nr:hypothetical protein [Kitasatospora sp. NRRL B-11411]
MIGSSSTRRRSNVLKGAAAAVAVVGLLSAAGCGSGGGPATDAARPSTSAPPTSTSTSYATPSASRSGGLTIQAGCEDHAEIMKELDQVTIAGRYGNKPEQIGDLLREAQGRLSADVARAKVPAVKEGLQKELAGVTAALDAYTAGDSSGVDKGLLAATLGGASFACIKAATEPPA